MGQSGFWIRHWAGKESCCDTFDASKNLVVPRMLYRLRATNPLRIVIHEHYVDD
jgi:hypothetical protein